MATALHFSTRKPSLTDPTTMSCYNLALQTFDSVVSFNPQSWQHRLDSEGAMLFTASFTISSESNSPESAANNPAIHGFLSTCRRQHLELPSPTLHISLAAVNLSRRGQGIFPRLLSFFASRLVLFSFFFLLPLLMFYVVSSNSVGILL